MPATTRTACVTLPLSLALALACGGTTVNRSSSLAQDGSALAVERIAALDLGAGAARERLVVRSDREWSELWARVAARTAAAPPRPPVDFSREMVVFACAGQQSSGGHAVDVARAALDAGVLHVTVVETSPGKGCMTTQAFTAPAIAVKLSRTDGPVVFSEASATHDCD